MVAEIIAVGTELLLGDIVNSNAQFLSRQLALLGIDVHFQSVVGDNRNRLIKVVELAKSRSDLLIITGGLGPTQDDLTKETVCEVFDDTLRLDKEELKKLNDFFAQRNMTMPQSNKKQAMVPTKGRKIDNDNGTAPGVIFEQNGKYAVLLPGPPKEMSAMFIDKVKPWLAGMSDNVMHSTVLRISGIGESHLEPLVENLLQSSNPTSGLYAKQTEVTVRVTAKANTQLEAQKMCDEMVEKYYSILGDYIYARDAHSLEQVVVENLINTNKIIAIAESCTGGMLAQKITSVSGSSSVFGYGVVVYSNNAKEQLLRVNPLTLSRYGAVSAHTAVEMAQGVRVLSDADYGISITGIAGPNGGTDKKPVGTVYIAAVSKKDIFVQKISATGRPRKSVQLSAVQNALDILRRLSIDAQQPMCKHFTTDQIFDWVE